MKIFFKLIFFNLFLFDCNSQNSLNNRLYNFKDSILYNPFYSPEQALSVSGYYKESLELDQENLEEELIFDTAIKSKEPSIGINAINQIKKISEKENVLIINEAHNKPNHRIFINKLLIELAPNYSLYLPETFINNDCHFNHLMPKICKKYTFANEPNFAKILRTAAKLGYTILPYEHYNDSLFEFHIKDTIMEVVFNGSASREKFIFSLKEYNLANYSKREIVQAINIKRIITKFPNKKIIIHCGYAHGSREAPNMAYFLKTLNVKFATIDQTYFNESSKPIKYLKEYQENINLNFPYTLINKKDSSVVKFSKLPPIIADMYIFHPPTKYVNKRPTWLRYNKSITPCQINHLFSKNTTEKNLFLVYIKGEFDALKYDAIPFDIIEQNSNSEKIIGYFEKYIEYHILRKSLNNKIESIEFKVDF